MTQAKALAQKINGLIMDIDGGLRQTAPDYQGLMSLVASWKELKEEARQLPPDTFCPSGLALAEVGLRKLADGFAQAVGDAEADEAAHLELVAEAEAALELAKAKLTLAQAATSKAHKEIRGLGELLG